MKKVRARLKSNVNLSDFFASSAQNSEYFERHGRGSFVLLAADKFDPHGGVERWIVVDYRYVNPIRIWNADIKKFFDILDIEADAPVNVTEPSKFVPLCPNGVKALSEQSLKDYGLKVKTVRVQSQDITADELEDFITELRGKFNA